MAVSPNNTRMSVEEYLTLDSESVDARYEYIDGYAYILAGGTADHSILALNVAQLLRIQLRGGPCRVYNADMKVHISKQQYLIPDVSVSCDTRDRGKVNILHYPHIVIEVLSPSTELYDRVQKFELYRMLPTLQEYVLINSQRQVVDVYRRASEKLWTLYPYSSGEHVTLHSLDITFSMDELYEEVVFTEDEHQ